MEATHTPAFYHPRYWPTWLGFGILWCITRLPLGLQLKIGKTLGHLLYLTMKKRRHITTCNITLCFPKKSPPEQQQLIKACFHSFGMGLVELAISWWVPKKKLQHLITLDNFDVLGPYLGKSPIIVLGAHLMSMDLAAKLLPNQYEYAVIYRPAKNKLFDAYLLKKRQQIFKAVIARDDAKTILKTLHQKIPVWLAPDQDYGIKRSVFADFLGVPTATITSVSRLATMTEAKVIPIFHHRDKNHNGYRVSCHPPLENFPSDNPQADARAINQMIEKAIDYDPSQYIWQHRRFKTRPAGHANIYS